MLGGKGHSDTTKLVKKNLTFMHLQAVGMQKFSDFPQLPSTSTISASGPYEPPA